MDHQDNGDKKAGGGGGDGIYKLPHKLYHQQLDGNKRAGGGTTLPIGGHGIYKLPHQLYHPELEDSRRSGPLLPHKLLCKKEICTICLDDIDDRHQTVGVLRCKHEYHADCIQKWLCIEKFCPLCKVRTLPDHVSLKKQDNRKY